MEPNPHILRHHHITLSVGTAQEDYDFHTQVLGLKSVKKTALYDGDEPRFGERMLCFSHPCGIGYAMVAIDDDNRRPYSNGHIPAEFGIRGTHGITVSLRDADSSDEFMQYGWSGKQRRVDGNCIRYKVGSGGSGCIIDFLLEPNLPQGSWAYGEGVVHHCAFKV